MLLTDQFLQYFPEFVTTDFDVLDQIEFTISRAVSLISVNTYQDFYLEALFLKTASLLFATSRLSGNQGEASRSVSGEYSVTYANPYSRNGLMINPYEQRLVDLNKSIGIGLGMIIHIE